MASKQDVELWGEESVCWKPNDALPFKRGFFMMMALNLESFTHQSKLKMTKQIIVVAGGTGDIGGRITKALLGKGAEVRILLRTNGNLERAHELEKMGAKVIELDMTNVAEITKACSGASCVVSPLAGFAPGEMELYPAWQGMQYMRNMMDERANLPAVANN